MWVSAIILFNNSHLNQNIYFELFVYVQSLLRPSSISHFPSSGKWMWRKPKINTMDCLRFRFPFSCPFAPYSGFTLTLIFFQSGVYSLIPSKCWLAVLWQWIGWAENNQIYRDRGMRLLSCSAVILAAIITARRRRLSLTVQKHHRGTESQKICEYVPCYQNPKRVSFMI